MINHKKILTRFNQIEKKYFSNSLYDISKNQLHFLLLNKSFIFVRFTLSGYIANLILLILSLVSVFFSKIKNISNANYFIVHKGQNGKYDFRSNYVLENFEFKNSLNIVRCISFVDCLKVYIKYPNVIFYLSFDYFNNIFSYHRGTLIEDYKILHKKEIKNYQSMKKVFKFLKIKKFLSIDDQRVMQVFLKVCKDLDIESFGYMHYKFSKFVIGIKYLCFDNFIVWSEYFKKKLIEVNKEYRFKKIFISGFPKKLLKRSDNSKKVNLLFIIDLDLNYNSTSKLLIKLNKINSINLYIKLKPQIDDNKWLKFCIKHNIKFFEYETLDKINHLIKMNYFIGNISTAIIEAPLYNAMPLKIISNNDFADDLIEDKVVKKVMNYGDILKITGKKPSQSEIDKFYYKIWGKKKYSQNFIKKIFINHIYDKY